MHVPAEAADERISRRGEICQHNSFVTEDTYTDTYGATYATSTTTLSDTFSLGAFHAGAPYAMHACTASSSSSPPSRFERKATTRPHSAHSKPKAARSGQTKEGAESGLALQAIEGPVAGEVGQRPLLITACNMMKTY